MRSAIIILIACSSVCLSQTITGVVSDGKTNEPLPYVHIGIAGKNLGEISRDDGSFVIDLSKADPADKLVFSIIGYETRSYQVGDLASAKMDVRLNQKIYRLKEVIVRPTEKPTIKLGRYEPTKTTTGQSGLKEFGHGGEWGLRIFNEGKKYFVTDARFHMRYNTVDSVLFRINMYNVVADMPGESILQRELFMTARKNKKWIIRDLVRENISIKEDVIVTVEVVRVWFGKRGENRIFFTHGNGYEQGRTFYRASSQDAWTVDQHPPATLYLTVEEY
jgi:hypothetical protein